MNLSCLESETCESAVNAQLDGASMKFPRLSLRPLLQRARLPSWQAAQSTLANLALPPICAGCEKDIELADSVPLCLACQRAFTMAGEAICVRCAAPAPLASIKPTGCVHCAETSFRFKN